MIKKIILGLLIYLVFMLVLFPAKVAVSLAPLPKFVKLSEVSGTIWNANIASVSLPQRTLEQVQLSIKPLALLTGKLEADVTLGSRSTPVTGKAHIIASTSHIKVTNLSFDAPDSFVLGNTRLPFKTKVDGEVSLVVSLAEQGKPWCSALNGKVFLNQTQVENQFGHYPLGNIELGLSCLDGKVKLSTDEKRNDLGLNGDILLDAGNRVKVTAKIRPTAKQPEDLTRALSFLGRQDSQGYYPITYQGRIPGM